MKKIDFRFDYWSALDQYIKETYSDKTVFIYDSELSFFDIDDIPLVNPILYLFDSVLEFNEWECSDNRDFCDMVSNLSVLYVNGKRDEEIIYKLRG